MTTAKLHINFKEGLFEAEGETDFVLKAYEDFKTALEARGQEEPEESQADAADASTPPRGRARSTRPKRPAASRKGAANDSGDANAGVSKYKPSRDTDLDLSKLAEFVGQYEPKNAAERILLYAEFLKQVLSKEPCTVDQIYSCFYEFRTQEAIPKAFGQNLINTRGDKYGYIDFTTIDDIRITTVGMNHFNLKMTKKAEAAE